jgi:NAD-dependent dihydropyrimidine dehydrogenase PreA subunit
MVTRIYELACVNCGLCEKICPMDVFRVIDGHMMVAYVGDCVSCLQCVSVCPVDAIGVVPGKPAKFNMDNEMAEIKKMMGFEDHPNAAQIRMPPWKKT